MGRETTVTSEDIGARLQAARYARGLTLSDVERETGGRFRRSTLHYYEHGVLRIPAVRLVELASVLGVTPADVLEPL